MRQNNFLPANVILAIALIFISFISCNTNKSEPKEANELHFSSNLEKWQAQKFSMFIHWGIYSIPAGVWNGEQISGYSEQIKGHANISTAAYSKLAGQFNPVLWNADSITTLAKQAGMKSIILTSKHHDGFNMFDTKFSEFNVVDATPFKRDVIKELSESCKRQELGFGVYFSLIDWNYPDALPFTSTRNSDSIPPLHHKYNLNQVEELLTNYGAISEIWFDMGSPSLQQSKEIAELVKYLQPNCLISGRLWNDQGDFFVMGDNKQPNFKMGVPWQSPASMFDETWSYRSWQERGDVNLKIKDKIQDLINIVSMGGNYLLNIGPKADGSVIPYEKQVLEGVGKWLRVNGESVYATNSSPLKKQDWGVVTTKPGKLYLHILDNTKDKNLVLKGLRADITNIYPLSDKNLKLEGKQQNDKLQIHLNDQVIFHENATVIVVEYKGDIDFTSEKTAKINKNGGYVLSNRNAVKLHSFSGHDYYSTRPTTIKMEWNLFNKSNKDFTIEVNCNPKEISENLLLKINQDEYNLAIHKKSNSSKNSFLLNTSQNISLKPNIINKVSLQYYQSKNKHKNLPYKELEIKIKPTDKN